MALYELVQHCDYGGMKDEMIRDRLVVGICDSSLSEKLQLDPALTLEKAKKAIRQSEAVHEQQKMLKGNSKPTAEYDLDAMQHRQQSNRCITIRDSDKIPTPTEVKDENNHTHWREKHT